MLRHSVFVVLLCFTSLAPNCGGESPDSNKTDVWTPARRDLSQSAQRIGYGVLGIVGVIDNSLAAVAFHNIKNVFSPSAKTLFIHQCVVDSLWSLSMTLYHLHIHRARFGDPPAIFDGTNLIDVLACKVYFSNFIFWTLMMLSAGNMLAIAGDRWLAVTRPVPYRVAQITARWRYWLTGVLAVCWMCALASHSLFFQQHSVRGGHCVYNYSDGPTYAGLLSVSMKLFIPLTVLTALYGHMLTKIGQHMAAVDVARNEQQQGQHKEGVETRNRRHTTKTARKTVFIASCLLCGTYLVCITPNQIFFLYFSLGHPAVLNGWLHLLTTALVNLNCVVNPLTYCCTLTPFRKEFVRMFRRRPCARRP